MLYWSSREEIPHAQGKRNPSKMVGVARGHQREDTLKLYLQKSSQSNHTRTTALSNSMKLSHAHGATQDEWVMVERSDRLGSTGEGNGKPLQYPCLGQGVSPYRHCSRREAKSKGEKKRYKHLNAEFQRIARRDKKAFFSDQYK